VNTGHQFAASGWGGNDFLPSFRVRATMSRMLCRDSNCAIASGGKPRRIARLSVNISLVDQLGTRHKRPKWSHSVDSYQSNGRRLVCTNYACNVDIQSMNKLTKREKLKRLRERLMRTTDEAECQRIVNMIEEEEAK
jgi:ANC1 homology domain (AHD)